MQFPAAYNPKDHEAQIYELWEKSGAFKTPTYREGEKVFSLVAPPPNANAEMHIGTGLTLMIEDAFVRYNRLKGRVTLFLPGADHAGFETQSVYERQLAEQGKSRFDFSREDLYRQIWDFVADNRGKFEKQMRALGASFDWGKFVFTLDNKVIKQTYATFEKMWGEGLIYRGERLVNFCTYHGTSFADIEVEHRQVNGHLWYIRYPLTDGSGEVAVATTRPETMLGDTAVAVHPNDTRYKKLIGKSVKLPLTNREIPVIADKAVDAEFGTGAVKITPAHDQNDYEMAERHDLPHISVIGHDGKITHEAPEAYTGLAVKEARKKVVADLEQQGYLIKIEPHRHAVAHCYRCDTVIQPLLREQWFVNMRPLVKPAREALESGQIKFYPSAKREQLLRYWEGLKDWNISRQIAWGIPIPAFQSVDDPSKWIFDDRVDQESIEVDGKLYHRDPDVFDTWFSSGSWPYVTLNFPDGEDFKRFYPLSLMETGGEILYPWVSRMILLGLYITKQVPFKEIYIHGYVMAEDGSKMSKSIGNVINLTDVIDNYGSDAMRMGLMAGRVPGVNRGYDSRRVEEARNLCNKLWNIARYYQALPDNSGPTTQSIADEWILEWTRLMVSGIDSQLERYRLAGGYEKLYWFIWTAIADWYVEASKIMPNKAVLSYVLESALKIAHPFAPFVTEAIWQQLKFGDGSMLAAEKWPKLRPVNHEGFDEFEEVKSIVVEARRICADSGLKKPRLIYKGSEVVSQNTELIVSLARLGGVEQGEGRGIRLNIVNRELWLEADAGAIKAYGKKLRQYQQESRLAIKQLEKRLDNKAYVVKAPVKLVSETKDQLKHQQALLDQLEVDLARLG